MKQENVSNYWETIFKQAYNENNYKECIKAIFNLARPDGTGIIDILYRKGNLLKNPLSYKFSEEDYKKVSNIIGNTFRILNSNDSLLDNYSLEFLENLKSDVVQLLYLYRVLYPNHVSNEEIISKHKPFKEQNLALSIKQILIFIQDQSRLMLKDVFSDQQQIADNGGYITGNEIYVSKKIDNKDDAPKESHIDNFESLISGSDNLIRFLYYTHDYNYQTEEQLSQIRDATPYMVPDFEKMLTLSMIDVLHNAVESRFRYANWNFFCCKNFENIKMYGVKARNEISRKIDLIGIYRRAHSYWLAISFWTNQVYGKRVQHQDVNENQSIFQLDEYIDISKRLDINNPEMFHFINQQEYIDISRYADIPINAAKEFIKPYYLNCTFDGINIEDLLSAFRFIYTYCKIYLTAAFYCFDEENKSTYDYLIPSISIDYLCKEFSSIASIDIRKATKLINYYIFNTESAKKKTLGDLFTRPLVQINSKQVLLCEVLIGQTNLMRSVETVLTGHGVNLARVGKDYEKFLISELSKGKGIQVNTNHIEFDAYDGKRVEFDCVAVFDDNLLLIEAKSVLTPYDFDEYSKRKEFLRYGIEQVNRRSLVVQKDWEKFKEQVNIQLPENPFTDDKIIKIVCTDIMNFTGISIDGVTIIDDKALIRYFTDPYISKIKKDGSNLTGEKQRVLWGIINKPSIDEFKEYIKEPFANTCILRCMDEQERPIPIVDEKDNPIVILDYGLKEDPWGESPIS